MNVIINNNAIYRPIFGDFLKLIREFEIYLRCDNYEIAQRCNVVQVKNNLKFEFFILNNAKSFTPFLFLISQKVVGSQWNCCLSEICKDDSLEHLERLSGV